MSDRVKGACLTMGGAACWGVSGCMGQYPTLMGIFGIFTVVVLLSLPAKQKKLNIL